jgi:hypothetical protein
MMFSRARRRFAVLTGFLWPCKEARKVIGTIHRSKRFDMAFYRASNPGMRWIFRLAPLRHYVTIGESRGLCPAPWFSPVAYRRGHIVRSDSAFLDYLHRAEPIAVPQKDEPPDLSGWTQARARAPYAVVLHLYYPELWPEIRRDLSGARIDFDLFVSLSGAAATPGGVAEDILASFPDARIAKVPRYVALRACRQLRGSFHLSGGRQDPRQTFATSVRRGAMEASADSGRLSSRLCREACRLQRARPGPALGRGRRSPLRQ